MLTNALRAVRERNARLKRFKRVNNVVWVGMHWDFLPYVHIMVLNAYALIFKQDFGFRDNGYAVLCDSFRGHVWGYRDSGYC